MGKGGVADLGRDSHPHSGVSARPGDTPLNPQRAIDFIPSTIDNELVLPAGRAVYAALVAELGIFDSSGSGSGGSGRCKALLAESPVRTRQREELRQRIGRLEMAKEAIRGFGSGV